MAQNVEPLELDDRTSEQSFRAARPDISAPEKTSRRVQVASRGCDGYRLDMDLICVDGIELRCIVGVHSYERHREQPVRVDLALGLDLSHASRSGRIAHTADYSWVTDATQALLRFRRYRLLEVAASEVVALLFAAYPIVEQVKIRIEKPEALHGRARTAAVEITRGQNSFATTRTNESYGERIQLLKTDEAVIERVEIRAGATAEFEDASTRLEWRVVERTVSPPTPEQAEPGRRTRYLAERDPLVLVRCISLQTAPHAAS